jgi:hypothetical protein
MINYYLDEQNTSHRPYRRISIVRYFAAAAAISIVVVYMISSASVNRMTKTSFPSHVDAADNRNEISAESGVSSNSRVQGANTQQEENVDIQRLQNKNVVSPEYYNDTSY